MTFIRRSIAAFRAGLGRVSGPGGAKPLPSRDALIARARQVACAMAAREGLAADEAELVSAGTNIILRLQPHNIVARTAP